MFKTQWGAYLSVSIAMLIWALSFIWSKTALNTYDPLFVLPCRLLLAATILFTFGKLSKRLQKIDPKDYKWLLLLAFFEPFLYFIGENYGLQKVSPTIAAVIIATIPLFLPFMAYLFFHEHISLFQGIGIGISFLGVAMVLVNKDMQFSADLIGVLLLLLAVFSALGYTGVLRRITAKYNPITIVAWQSLIAGIAFLPLFFSFSYQHTTAVGYHNKGIEAILLLALFGSSIAFIAYTQSVRILGITKSGVFANMIPVFTALFSFFLMNETLLNINYIGIIIVIGGLFLSQLSPLKHKKH